MKRIDRIVFEKINDPTADFSDYLGTYSEKRGPDCIDRSEDGQAHDRSRWRYFIPAHTAEETGNPESPRQDYERAEAYNRGEWSYVGIRAVAHVSTYASEAGPFMSHVVKSTGLWGVESDSEQSYFNEVARQQLLELAEILWEFGMGAEVADFTSKRKPEWRERGEVEGPGPIPYA